MNLKSCLESRELSAYGTLDSLPWAEKVDERSRTLGLRWGAGSSEVAALGGGKKFSSSFPGLIEDSTGCWFANGLDVLSEVDSALVVDEGDEDERGVDGLCLQS